MPYLQVEPSQVTEVCLSRPCHIEETAPLQETTPTTCHFLSQVTSRFRKHCSILCLSPTRKHSFYFLSLGIMCVLPIKPLIQNMSFLCLWYHFFFELHILYHSSSALLVWVPVACLNLFKQQADFLEGSTRGQSSSVVWFEHQIGRITASVIGSVSKCKECAYPYSLVNSIMQYSKPPSEWTCSQMGMSEEDTACK